MDISNPRQIMDRAEQCLGRASCDPRRLVLIYSGISAAALLILTLLNLLLSQGIAGTGGLSGMGLRSVLSSVANFLQMAANLALPFWSMGYVAAVLGFAREDTVSDRTLLAGFQNWGPIVRHMLVQGILVVALAFVCYYISFAIFAATPWAQPFLEAVAPLMLEADPVAAIDEAFILSIEDTITPLLFIFFAVFLPVYAVFAYRLRFAGYAIMEGRCGAIAAMMESFRLTRRHCGKLLKLDLRLWWYYVLQVAVTMVAYGSYFLVIFGVQTALDSQLLELVFYVLHLALQLGLNYWAMNRVEVSYALWYDARLNTPEPVQEQALGKHPWAD